MTLEFCNERNSGRRMWCTRSLPLPDRLATPLPVVTSRNRLAACGKTQLRIFCENVTILVNRLFKLEMALQMDPTHIPGFLTNWFD